MRMQRLAIALTVVNVVILVLAVIQIRSTMAQGTVQVIRGSALELVDERGVVRARLAVKRPSTVIELDLFDRNGINHVKLGAGDNGSGLLLTDETTGPATSYVQIIARRTGAPETPKTTSITLRGPDGRERVIMPP